MEALAYSSLWMAVQEWGDTDGETTAQVNPHGSEDLSQGGDQENHMEAHQKSASQSSVLIIITEGREFSGSPAVRDPPCIAGNADVIPGQGTKIPYTLQSNR